MVLAGPAETGVSAGVAHRRANSIRAGISASGTANAAAIPATNSREGWLVPASYLRIVSAEQLACRASASRLKSQSSRRCRSHCPKASELLILHPAFLQRWRVVTVIVTTIVCDPQG